MDDREIIDMYFQRSEAAIDETAKKYGNYCFAIANQILQDRSEAEESVNDTYLQAWNSIPPARPDRLSAYLGKIVRNISLNRRKARRTQKRGSGECALAFEELETVISSSASANEIVDEIYLKDVLNRWLDTLTREQRMVFVGRYWYFDSVSGISDKMNFSVSKTKMLLLRLRNELKEYLEKEGIHL